MLRWSVWQWESHVKPFKVALNPHFAIFNANMSRSIHISGPKYEHLFVDVFSMKYFRLSSEVDFTLSTYFQGVDNLNTECYCVGVEYRQNALTVKH